MTLLTRALNQLSPAHHAFRRAWPKIDAVPGLLISPMQERWLFNAARGLPNGATIVEIGSFQGRSTSCLAFGCRGTRKHVHAIDTFAGNDRDFTQSAGLFDGAPFADTFRQNIARNGLTPYVTQHIGRSADIGKTWTQPIRMLYIDGGHEFEDVYTDFATFFPHVVPGSLVAFHDVHDFRVSPGPVGFPGVQKVWEEIARPQLRNTGMCATLAYGRKT